MKNLNGKLNESWATIERRIDIITLNGKAMMRCHGSLKKTYTILTKQSKTSVQYRFARLMLGPGFG